MELEDLYTQKGNSIATLESRVKHLEQEINNCKIIMGIEKLVNNVKLTLKVLGRTGANFGNGDDMVELNEKYPHAQIPMLIKTDLEQMVSEGNKRSSAIFRRLISVLIPDTHTWAESNGAKQLISKHEQLFITSHATISPREKPRVSNQMCAEARRTLRRANETTLVSDSTVVASGADKVDESYDGDMNSENEAAKRDWKESCMLKRKYAESFTETDLELEE